MRNKLDQLMEALIKKGVSKNYATIIEGEIKQRIKNEPDPKIAFIGFSGVGKSSTLNALFNAGQEISHVKACTQIEKEIYGDYSQYFGSKGSVKVWDMPGMGEDIIADKQHLETYKRVLPIVDVAVWTIQADYRAMTPMQNTILTLQKVIGAKFINKLMFAINKADTGTMIGLFLANNATTIPVHPYPGVAVHLNRLYILNNSAPPPIPATNPAIACATTIIPVTFNPEYFANNPLSPVILNAVPNVVLYKMIHRIIHAATPRITPVWILVPETIFVSIAVSSNVTEQRLEDTGSR